MICYLNLSTHISVKTTTLGIPRKENITPANITTNSKKKRQQDKNVPVHPHRLHLHPVRRGLYVLHDGARALRPGPLRADRELRRADHRGQPHRPARSVQRALRGPVCSQSEGCCDGNFGDECGCFCNGTLTRHKNNIPLGRFDWQRLPSGLLNEMQATFVWLPNLFSLLVAARFGDWPGGALVGTIVKSCRVGIRKSQLLPGEPGLFVSCRVFWLFH